MNIMPEPFPFGLLQNKSGLSRLVKTTKNTLKKLSTAGVNFKEPKLKQAADILNGKKFVFTGELVAVTRAQAGSAVKKLGGDVLSSVSKNTDFVVIGKSPGSKYKKALELGVKVINEKQFQEMINV